MGQNHFRWWFVCCFFLLNSANAELASSKTHALSLGIAPKYDSDFSHLDYVNPNAPKGGSLRLFAIGGFDSFNPFIIKGDPAVGLPIRFYESLMTTPSDDNLSEYGLIAETVEVADDLSFVIYDLRKEAQFHDGSPITADDVIFSFNVLVKQGTPFYREYYKDISQVEALTSHRVKFTFSGPPNRELPQIVGQLYVFPKAYWETRDFSKTTLEPPLSSGPYRIASFEPGRYVIFERNEKYWGADLPINVGRYNYDTIRYDYVRDATIAVEAFKSGEYDFRSENTSKTWATAYDFPGLRAGLVRKEAIPHSRATGMPAFVFNTRKSKFRNRIVREALGMAFDFEWTNERLFYGQYTRSKSYFENSELASSGLPRDEELALLNPYRGLVPDAVFEKEFDVPTTDGSGNIRGNLINAVLLLRNEGWRVVDNRLIDPESGEPMTIEFLLNSPGFERIVAPFIRNLKRLGIDSQIRTVEPAQYQNRIREFDFDMIVYTFRQSNSPGNEQRAFWSSIAADQPGARNYAGINNPTIDELVEKVIGATTRKELIHATRALDRVLLWNHFVIPTWFIKSDRVLWWDKFGLPEIMPKYGIDVYAWWVDPIKDAKVNDYRQAKD